MFSALFEFLQIEFLAHSFFRLTAFLHWDDDVCIKHSILLPVLNSETPL